MRKERRKKKKNKSGFAASCALGFVAFLAVYFGWFSRLNLSLQDSIYQRPGSVDPEIKIIAIDEKTLEALGPFSTWTREPWARLIETLNQGEDSPRVIGLDILFIGEKGEEDQLLEDACRESSNVVMAENLVFSTQVERENGRTWVNDMHLDMVEEPFGELPDLVTTGFVNTVQDSQDNAVRYTLLKQEGHVSFAAAIAEKAERAAGEKGNDRESAAQEPRESADAAAGGAVSIASMTDQNGGMLIDYTGRPGSYEILSMINVLNGEIPSRAFRDSIVLAGAYAPGMGDAYTVPIGRGSQMYGVEIHANIVQGLLEGRRLLTLNSLWNGIALGAIVFLLTLWMEHSQIWLSGVIAAAAVSAEIGLCFWLDSSSGLVINIVALPLAAAAAFVWNVAAKYGTEALQKRKIIRAFQKYVAPQVVREIAGENDFQLKLGGEKRDIAVLFVDIRGFTPLSETLKPEEVVEILNEYLSMVTEAVFKNDGMLDKFIGDAAMAVFNAPVDCPDYVYKAVCCARDIAAESDRIADQFLKRFGKKVSFGIGVNCGEAVVGNIGSQVRMDYTAIGDTVNTAARLEANAKAGQILISQAVYEKLEGRIEAAEIGVIPLKGKANGVMVYSVGGKT